MAQGKRAEAIPLRIVSALRPILPLRNRPAVHQKSHDPPGGANP
jgi:hypothetical protein